METEAPAKRGAPPEPRQEVGGGGGWGIPKERVSSTSLEPAAWCVCGGRFQHSCIFLDSKLLIVGGRGPEVNKSLGPKPQKHLQEVRSRKSMRGASSALSRTWHSPRPGFCPPLSMTQRPASGTIFVVSRDSDTPLGVLLPCVSLKSQTCTEARTGFADVKHLGGMGTLLFSYGGFDHKNPWSSKHTLFTLFTSVLLGLPFALSSVLHILLTGAMLSSWPWSSSPKPRSAPTSDLQAILKRGRAPKNPT